MPLMWQALQLGRLVHTIVTSVLGHDSHSLLSSKAVLSKLAKTRRPALTEIAVLAEPNEHDDEDLLGESKAMHRVVSVHRQVLSKKASLSQRLMREKEKHALKHEKRVLFALRTLMLLRRLNRGSLHQLFSMTAVRFESRYGCNDRHSSC